MKCQRIVSAETDQICGHPVSGGGNMHKLGHCPPAPRPGDNHLFHAKKRRNSGRQRDENLPSRGVPVAGIHKVSASSKQSRSPKIR